MAFPVTDLDVRVDLLIDGSWTDITDNVYVRDTITITRGRSDEGSEVEPSTCSFTVNNRDGRFSPRNPVGPYYGLIGRNTRVRVIAGAGSPRLALFETDDYVSTPDSAGLSITGDIDLRVDASLTLWHTDETLLSKATHVIPGLDQNSYELLIFNGHINLNWSSDGVTLVPVESTVPVPRLVGRQAVRATMDVDNGAAGHTITFYTAPTMAGPWEQLGDPVVRSGVTSIADTTAALEVGREYIAGTDRYETYIFAAEVRQGINGTVRANPDFTVQAEAATSFVDGAGNTWTNQNIAQITNRRVRFIGEVSSWPVSWEVDQQDVAVRVEAAGVLRRLGQGSSPLRSAYTGAVIGTASNVVAYWPLEDSEGSSTLASGLAGGRAMKFKGAPRLAVNEDFIASGPLPEASLSSFTGTIAPYVEPAHGAGVVTEAQLWFLARVPTGTATGTVLASLTFQNARFDLVYGGGTGNLSAAAYNADGAVVDSSVALGAFEVNDRLLRYALELQAFGLDTTVTIRVREVGAVSSTSLTDSAAIAGLGRATKVVFNPNMTLDAVPFGQISVQSAVEGLGEPELREALDAFDGEFVTSRFFRLTVDLGQVGGVPAGSNDGDAETKLGAQKVATYLDLIREAVAVDMGVLSEVRAVDSLTLQLRTRTSLYNQSPALALAYDDLVTLTPVDDDQAVRNDITVSRPDGSSARVEETAGPLSTLSPPDGVGRYDESLDLNVQTDGDLADQASWRLHLGTVDETRYPNVNLELSSPAFSADGDLTAAVLDLAEGDLITIDDPPSFAGSPDQIRALVLGWSETIEPYGWAFDLYTTPASPYTVAVPDSDDLARMDSETSTLAEALDSAETAVDVAVQMEPCSARWITTAGQPGDFPFDVRVGGEVMTVSAATGSVEDAFGRTVASGWGDADIGGTWVRDGGGAASTFSVGSGYGSMVHASTSVARLQLLTSPVADVDVYVDIASSVIATGASIGGGPMVRAVDSSNYVLAEVQFTTAGSLNISLGQRIVSTTTLASLLSVIPVYTAGTFYRVRLQVIGTLARAKVWDPAVSREPSWQVSGTLTGLSAAANVGCRSISSAGNTNVSPSLRFDNFKVANPQRLTVTRAVNGVVKSHATAAPISLARPNHIAL